MVTREGGLLRRIMRDARDPSPVLGWLTDADIDFYADELRLRGVAPRSRFTLCALTWVIPDSASASVPRCCCLGPEWAGLVCVWLAVDPGSARPRQGGSSPACSPGCSCPLNRGKQRRNGDQRYLRHEQPGEHAGEEPPWRGRADPGSTQAGRNQSGPFGHRAAAAGNAR